MNEYTVHGAKMIPLDRENVDTDQIIPKQFLKSIKKSGFGPNLFDSWRYLDTGYPGQDNSKRPINKDFVINKEEYSGSEILIAKDNFGCGSSREHAVWALQDFGIKSVIAPSFADIFFNNCFKNGLLAIEVNQETVELLFNLTEQNNLIYIDLENQSILDSDERLISKFDIEPFRKKCILEGLDEIGISLQYKDKIKIYEESLKNKSPWIFR
tara:strand:- start:14594 stop:15229 length:636 start_codon:yes stop_codon:yes gene_type:complete